MKRISLATVVRGPGVQPIRALLYSSEGLGKTTFAAGAPAPIFICPEDGFPPALTETPRFPPPEGGWSWQDILDAVQLLTDEAHAYQTLVLDTLDWIEPIVWAHACKKAGVTWIEDIGGGYGKGYVAALDEWRSLIARLERLRKAKGMNVIALAHSQIKPFKDPLSEGYDRFELKLHKSASGLWKEWTDVVLFAQHEDLATKDARTKRVRGVSTGARVIRTTHHAAWDAKNRHNLPETLPLSWEDFAAALVAGVADVRAEILRKAKELDLESQVAEALKKAGDNATSLALINNKLNVRIAEREQPAAPSAEKAG